ncbi:MAG: maleylpyruvate isomerase N-terminal domain-containing protein [Propionicimonas sp.]
MGYEPVAPDWGITNQAFADAAAWFVAVVAQVGDRWAEPGLGEWDVRALVGHTSRAMLTVESYLARPAASIEVPSALAYYRATRDLAAGPAVAQRGRDAGLALGADPVAAVTELKARVLPVVAGLNGGELLTTIAGGMRIADYLPTRVFELVVHTADLATALGVPAEPPAGPGALALGLVAELAIDDGTATALLLAATGRGSLAPGFTVL